MRMIWTTVAFTILQSYSITCYSVQRDSEIRVALRRTTGRFIFPFSGGQHPKQQTVLGAGEVDERQNDNHGAGLTVMYHLMYITHISIGSPPQLFRAVVDITQSNLFVPSWNCTSNSKNYEIEYCMPHLMYDGSRSSTHEDILESAQVHYYGMYGWGNLSRDTVCIAELCILGQDFKESTRWHPAYLIDWDEQYDSALGLSRFQSTNTYDDFNNTRILQALHEQKLLARNVFALKHPRTDEDTGELILGGSDRTFAGSLVKLPLIDLPMDSIDSNYIPYASAGWNVDASSIHMGAFAEKTALDIALPGYAAVMTNSYANIMFPGVINRQILSHFNLSQDHYGDYTFDCDKRHIFPNFTIALGPQKHEFVLEPWQYMHEVIDPNGQQRCTFPFKILYEDEEHPDYILLGAAFLASWYAEFDLDEGTVGLARHWDPSSTSSRSL